MKKNKVLPPFKEISNVPPEIFLHVTLRLGVYEHFLPNINYIIVTLSVNLRFS
jgi:hypothetical protein